ncbi:AAA family ATPase [Desulfosporosinus youngiae]|uniref:Nitric oxide reductase activation protein n=1 Tax=Desulfosporosinus youngiae DSM 17734 TaxID=768710 RepID=H5XVH4_9FIRM|nr:AAA family ATPase [Desulfosporosinus youngiae]EHQ89910.1 nitric oxide reductase activation protein [Desulfosporosinus youngiae DSM 17734]
MKNQWLLSPARQLTEEEKSLVWQKPVTHIESDAERRICAEVYRNWTRGEMKITNILLEGDAGSGKTQLAKALSADFGLPYTKVTCFADMDKSDVLGSILPVLPEDENNTESVIYKYYPSEIVRAYENGWLLEIQEPTVIRDAAVLMSLNSALEPDGSINLPTRIVHRHPDFIAVITTNRGYNGCRPLNEALRDRVQHSEKMDLPSVEVMTKRAASKTGCTDEGLLLTFARVIVLLDQTAKANAIKGVAGMRSYFFWVDAALQGSETVDALYHKVIYKITTDPDEIVILEQALSKHGMLSELEEIWERRIKTNGEVYEVMEIHTEEAMETESSDTVPNDIPAVALQKSADSEGQSNHDAENAADTQSSHNGEGGDPIYHELQQTTSEKLEQQRREFRKHLNQQAREMVKGSPHEKVNLIVHRPEATLAHHREYHQIAYALMPVIRELVRKTVPLLEHEVSMEFAKSCVYGTKFHAEKLASLDFHYYSQKCPPDEDPSLAVALRIDESASMSAFGRLDAAKQAAVAVYEFCESCKIPMLIYGDTADRSSLERMSLYSYIDYENPALNDKYCLMAIQGHSNNRDGMALRILSEKLMKAPQKTKLLISISDGQPKAMPDYTGEAAIADMKGVLQEYSRKGVLFLAAAIGRDKETICDIYGQERFLDITDLRQLPARLVQVIAKYL